MFGFNQPIAHGMWSMARCLAALDARTFACAVARGRGVQTACDDSGSVDARDLAHTGTAPASR